MADQPQQIAPSASPADDGWKPWGPVYDRQATLGVITMLQGKGLQVRFVKAGNRNELYTREVTSSKCRAPDCIDMATVHVHLDDGRLLPLCEQHALELVPDEAFQ